MACQSVLEFEPSLFKFKDLLLLLLDCLPVYTQSDKIAYDVCFLTILSSSLTLFLSDVRTYQRSSLWISVGSYCSYMSISLLIPLSGIDLELAWSSSSLLFSEILERESFTSESVSTYCWIPPCLGSSPKFYKLLIKLLLSRIQFKL